MERARHTRARRIADRQRLDALLTTCRPRLPQPGDPRVPRRARAAEVWTLRQRFSAPRAEARAAAREAEELEAVLERQSQAAEAGEEVEEIPVRRRRARTRGCRSITAGGCAAPVVEPEAPEAEVETSIETTAAELATQEGGEPAEIDHPQAQETGAPSEGTAREAARRVQGGRKRRRRREADCPLRRSARAVHVAGAGAAARRRGQAGRDASGGRFPSDAVRRAPADAQAGARRPDHRVRTGPMKIASIPVASASPHYPPGGRKRHKRDCYMAHRGRPSGQRPGGPSGQRPAGVARVARVAPSRTAARLHAPTGRRRRPAAAPGRARPARSARRQAPSPPSSSEEGGAGAGHVLDCPLQPGTPMPYTGARPPGAPGQPQPAQRPQPAAAGAITAAERRSTDEWRQ